MDWHPECATGDWKDCWFMNSKLEIGRGWGFMKS